MKVSSLTPAVARQLLWVLAEVCGRLDLIERREPITCQRTVGTSLTLSSLEKPPKPGNDSDRDTVYWVRDSERYAHQVEVALLFIILPRVERFSTEVAFAFFVACHRLEREGNAMVRSGMP